MSRKTHSKIVAEVTRNDFGKKSLSASVLSVPDPKKNAKQLKAKLTKRAGIKKIFKKHNTPITETIFVLIQDFENSLLGVDLQFEMIDRESLKADKKLIKKIEKHVEQLNDGYLKQHLLQILTHKMNFKLPNLNEERNAVINRITTLGNHLQDQGVRKKESHLYPLLADIIEFIKPGMFILEDDEITSTHIRAFNNYF